MNRKAVGFLLSDEAIAAIGEFSKVQKLQRTVWMFDFSLELQEVAKKHHLRPEDIIKQLTLKGDSKILYPGPALLEAIQVMNVYLSKVEQQADPTQTPPEGSTIQ